MRIGIFLDKFPGISETFLIQHIGAMAGAGHDVFVFARETPAPEKTHPAIAAFGLPAMTRFLPNQERGVRQLMALPLALWRARRARGVVSTLNVFRYGTGVLRLRAFHGLALVSTIALDVIHCHYSAVGWAFLPYGELFDVPLITSFHGDHFAMFPRRREWMLRRLFDRGDAFVANSQHTRNELIRMGCPEAKVVTIPAIVDDRNIVPNDSSLVGPETHLVTVARLDAAKGIQCALRAVRLLVDQGCTVRYTIAGDGPFRQHLEGMVRELQLQEVVRFVGWQSQTEVYSILREADIFVLPSLLIPNANLESQGVVIQEAQLHGVPVVASDIGGVPESLDWGRAGTLFSSGDHADLAGKIAAIREAPADALRKAAFAKGYVRSKYAAAVVGARHESLYRALIGGAAINEMPPVAPAHAGAGEQSV